MLLIIIENFLQVFKFFSSIVSLGKDCSVLRFFSIEDNVKVYHRAGKGWTDVVAIWVTEKMHYSVLWPLTPNDRLSLLLLILILACA